MFYSMCVYIVCNTGMLCRIQSLLRLCFLSGCLFACRASMKMQAVRFPDADGCECDGVSGD